MLGEGILGDIFPKTFKKMSDEQATRQPALTEQKYQGIVQEYCARIGCKLGSIGPDILIMALTHKAGNIEFGATPPMAIGPNGAAIVVEMVAKGEVAVAQAGARAGAVLMAGGPEQTRKDVAGNPAPAEAPAEGKAAAPVDKQTEALKQKALQNLTEETKKEIKWEDCVNKRLRLNTEHIDKQIAEMIQGKKDLTDLKRRFTADGLTVEMKSGHSYYRDHLGGDVSRMGSLNEIEAGIIEDFKIRLDESLLKQTELIPDGKDGKFSLMINEFEIEYEPHRIGNFYSIDYYPKTGKI